MPRRDRFFRGCVKDAEGKVIAIDLYPDVDVSASEVEAETQRKVEVCNKLFHFLATFTEGSQKVG